MTQYGFAYDARYCNGCKTCILACKDRYDLDEDTAFRTVYEYGGGSVHLDGDGMLVSDCFGYYFSVACNHCDDPACVRACPTGAVHKDAETGLVVPNDDICIGCGSCVMACPYHNPRLNRQEGHSVKCTGCIGRVKQGLAPICVEACPQRALFFGPIDELRERFGSEADIAPLPSSSLTSPNLCIIAPVEARPSGDASGRVLNPLEV